MASLFAVAFAAIASMDAVAAASGKNVCSDDPSSPGCDQNDAEERGSEVWSLLQTSRSRNAFDNAENAQVRTEGNVNESLELTEKEYDVLGNGMYGCKEGFEIKTIAECQAATRFIEKKKGIKIPLTNTQKQDGAPVYCSLRISDLPANLYMMKFNPAGDNYLHPFNKLIAPLCVAERGCDDSKCDSAVGSDCCAPNGEKAACDDGYQVKMLSGASAGCSGFSNGAFNCCK